ncbi:MAG: heavy metal translocating P-type ATPase, partial [Planctomycetales bacterium]|nr:heavy metal translocating P-type ATPase [Planctomycetales bacterium]
MRPATDPQPPAAPARVECAHCGLPVPKGLIDPTAAHQFCCNGCRTVYEMIHANGLERFYRLRDAADSQPAKALTQSQDYQAFDDPAFLERQTRPTSGGLRAVELRLEGVHCAACLWLVERLPSIVPGVVDARLNLRSAMVRVTWNPQQVALSKIAATLQRLGYPSHPASEVTASQVRRKQERSQLVRLGVAGALAGNAMLIAIALYGGVFTGMEPQFEQLFRWLSSLLGVTALVWPGAVFFRGAWASVLTRRPSLDLPIALALTAGGAAGVVNTVLGRGEVYFDSLSVLVFLLLVGRWFQSRQQRWADEAVNLMHAFTPSICRVVMGDQVVSRPVDSLLADEIVQVRSGDLFPVDGQVESGQSSVNQALLTGESRAVEVGPGDKVFAGAQNLGGQLLVRVEHVGEATRVGGLMRLVDQGVREKPPIVQFTDRAAGWFLMAVIVLAATTFAGWALAAGVAVATDHTIALLIVACPCA